MNFTIGKKPKTLGVTGSSSMYVLANTGSRLNLVNLEYHQSVVKCHPNTVLKLKCLKDPDGLYLFNFSEVNGKN